MPKLLTNWQNFIPPTPPTPKGKVGPTHQPRVPPPRGQLKQDAPALTRVLPWNLHRPGPRLRILTVHGMPFFLSVTSIFDIGIL